MWITRAIQETLSEAITFKALRDELSVDHQSYIRHVLRINDSYISKVYTLWITRAQQDTLSISGETILTTLGDTPCGSVTRAIQ